MGKKSKKKKKAAKSAKHKDPNRKKIFKFLFLIIGLGTILLGVTSTDWFMEIVQPVLAGYAKVSSIIINIFGENTNASLDYITSSEFSLKVKKGCDAIAPIILLAVAILAFPSKNMNKWKGVLVGTLALVILNTIRIISLYFAGKYLTKTVFDFIHTELWQILFIICTLLIWLFWMKWSISKNEETLSLSLVSKKS